MASRNDLLKAQVKLNEAELMLQKAENGKALAGMNLCRVIGIDLYSSIQVSDSLCGEVTPGVLNAGEGLQQRPEYNLLEKDVELKEKQVALTRSDFCRRWEFLPLMDFGGNIPERADGGCGVFHGYGIREDSDLSLG